MLPFSKPTFLLLAVSTMSCLVHAQPGDEAPIPKVHDITWRVNSNDFTWRVKSVDPVASCNAFDPFFRSERTDEKTEENVTLTFSVTKPGSTHEIKITTSQGLVLGVLPQTDLFTRSGNKVVISKTEEAANKWELVCDNEVDAKQLMFFMSFVMRNYYYCWLYRNQELAICADPEGNDLYVVALQCSKYECFRVTPEDASRYRTTAHLSELTGKRPDYTYDIHKDKKLLPRWKKSTATTNREARSLGIKPGDELYRHEDGYIQLEKPTEKMTNFLQHLKKYTSYNIQHAMRSKARDEFIAKLSRWVLAITCRRRLQSESDLTMCSKRRLRGVSPVMLRRLEEIRAAQ